MWDALIAIAKFIGICAMMWVEPYCVMQGVTVPTVQNMKTFHFGPDFADQFRSSKGSLANVRYKIQPEIEWMPQLGFDFVQKLWVGVQILEKKEEMDQQTNVLDNLDYQSLRVTIVRLDNLTDLADERVDYETALYDALWREYAGWPVTLQIHLSNPINASQSRMIRVPANPNYDVMQFDITGEGFKPVERKEMEIQHEIWQVSGNYVGKYIFVLEKAMTLLELMNPHWKHHRTTVDLMEETIEKLEGNRRAANAFAGLQPIAYKVDLYRLVMLYHYGGVYADSRLVPIVPFDEILPVTGGLIPHDPDYKGIYNGFLALPKGSVLARQGIDQIIKNVQTKFYGHNNLEPTGPRMLFKVFNDKLTEEEQASFDRRFHLTTYPCRFVEDRDTLEIMIIVHNAEYRRRYTGRDLCNYHILHQMRAVYYEKPCIKGVGVVQSTEANIRLQTERRSAS